MNLRTCKALAAASALLFEGAACTDLTVEPKSTVTEANVFNDVASYRAFIARVYSGLAISGQQGPNGRPDLDPSFDEGFSQYVRMYWSAQALTSDEAVIAWHDIDLFGSTPRVTDADALGATPPQQATRQQIYDFVVSELTAIQGDLPADGQANYGRATRSAANMLLAKVYLNAKVYTGTAHYTEALTSASAVIAAQFSLDPSYRHLFLADNNTSPEIIFAVPQDGLKTQTWGGVTFLIHASCGGSMNNSLYGIDGCWWGLRLKQQAYNLFGPGDGRAASFYTSGQSVNVTNISDFTTGIAAPKFQNVTSTG